MQTLKILNVKEIVGILFLLTVTGCTSNVYIDYDTQADFSTYQTYAWAEGTPAKNSLMNHRIIPAIDKQLIGKGFRKVDTNPDMFGSYHAATTEAVSYTTWGTAMVQPAERPMVGTVEDLDCGERVFHLEPPLR
ncbi:MAG TPA: DUF4136 domain-containing protein [Nitrospirales bacterium]|nr:DUF4136 domain-containing protein [Nitrospirales bacterium]